MCVSRFIERSVARRSPTPPRIERLKSWIDLQRLCPRNPLDILAYAKLGDVVAVFQNNEKFYRPDTGGWIASPVTLNGTLTCIANGSDNQEKVENASQWGTEHITVGTDFTQPPTTLRTMFLRAGREWRMKIPLNFGAGNYSDILLSYRMNAATRGDAHGTVPVLAFVTGEPFTGAVDLEVTVLYPGVADMGLVMTNTGTNESSMYEMEWRIVP